MTARPTYTSATPSEQSIYYDAPIMHFFSNKSSGNTTPTRSDTASPAQDAGQPPSCDGNVSRHQSVPIPSNLVVNTRPANEADDNIGCRNLEVSGAAENAADAGSDSGYGSASGANQIPIRSASPASHNSGVMQPIPILWNGKEGQGDGQAQSSWRHSQNQQAPGDNPAKRAASMRSYRRRDRDRDSMSPSAFSERRRRVSLSGGSFANGAGTIGPAAIPPSDDGLEQRNAQVDGVLSPKQKSKVDKSQRKDAKRMSKVIKSEAKAEQQALEGAIRELSSIQKMQKSAIKEETKAYDSHGRALKTFHKEEVEFFARKVRYETAEADLQALEDAREAACTRAREITEMLQEKNREVEHLRTQKIVDDREREAKLKELSGKA